MILYKYYVVYVERITGYPGVEELYSQDCDIKTLLTFLERNKSYAVLKILEAYQQ